jgi:site-specific DNA recombinase
VTQTKQPPANPARFTFDLIRSLVEGIRLMPADGSLRIELAGDLASILSLYSGAKKVASGDAVLLEQVKMVAGIGFEPMTFRL